MENVLTTENNSAERDGDSRTYSIYVTTHLSAKLI